MKTKETDQGKRLDQIGDEKEEDEEKMEKK